MSVYVCIGVYGILMVTNPRYTIQVFPQIFWFTDIRGNEITNKERYFYWIETLWFEFVKFHPMKTLEESIDALKYANVHNNAQMYSYFFEDIERFWYENALEKYNDEIFSKKVLVKIISVDYRDWTGKWEKDSIKYFLENIKIIEYIKSFSHDKHNVEASKYTLERLDLYKKWFLSEKDFFKNIYKEVIYIYDKNY